MEAHGKEPPALGRPQQAEAIGKPRGTRSSVFWMTGVVIATTRRADAARGVSLGESRAGGRRDADGRGVLGVCEVGNRVLA